VYGDNVNAFAVDSKGSRYVFHGRKGVNEFVSIDQTGHTPYGVSKLTGAFTFRNTRTLLVSRPGVPHELYLWHATVRLLRTTAGSPGSRCESLTMNDHGFRRRKTGEDVLWVDDLVAALRSSSRPPSGTVFSTWAEGPEHAVAFGAS